MTDGGGTNLRLAVPGPFATPYERELIVKRVRQNVLQHSIAVSPLALQKPRTHKSSLNLVIPCLFPTLGPV